jgi:predicted nucleic acid-binding protein
MEFLELVPGSCLYLDTNIWIYALEGYADYISFLTDLFGQIDEGNLQAFTSALTLAEVLVKPFMDKNVERQQAYQRTLQNSAHLQIIPITRLILIQSAELRAAENYLKLPDAIHVATALAVHCDAFLTNDKRIRAVDPMGTISALPVLQLSDIIRAKNSPEADDLASGKE